MCVGGVCVWDLSQVDPSRAVALLEEHPDSRLDPLAVQCGVSVEELRGSSSALLEQVMAVVTAWSSNLMHYLGGSAARRRWCPSVLTWASTPFARRKIAAEIPARPAPTTATAHLSAGTAMGTAAAAEGFAIGGRRGRRCRCRRPSRRPARGGAPAVGAVGGAAAECGPIDNAGLAAASLPAATVTA